MGISGNGHPLPLPEPQIAIGEYRGIQVSTLEIEDRFCWDHGYHLGPRCPRCRREMEEPIPAQDA